MDEPPIDEDEARARARGARVALVLYFGVAVVVSAVAGGQVVWVGLRARPAPSDTFSSCPNALASLSTSLGRARTAASRAGGEDAALAAFRGALSPEWDALDVARALCGEAGRDDVGTVEALRYAEEHAIRREASELAPLRRRADEALRRQAP